MSFGRIVAQNVLNNLPDAIARNHYSQLQAVPMSPSVRQWFRQILAEDIFVVDALPHKAEIGQSTNRH